MSDHNLIEVEMEIFLSKIPKETFSYRKLKDITPEAINEVLITFIRARFAIYILLEMMKLMIIVTYGEK